jgi:hopene-associated glycosyltransferase HpnB
MQTRWRRRPRAWRTRSKRLATQTRRTAKALKLSTTEVTEKEEYTEDQNFNYPITKLLNYPILPVPIILDFAGALCLLAWLYLLLARGGFWRVSKLLPPVLNPTAATSGRRVAVIIPARNEAAAVGQSVRSLLAQSGTHHVHIFLVDDGSTDGTAEVARRAGATSVLTIIAGKPLPAGWTGKLWAVQQGIEAARDSAPEFLLLTDADILHAPDNVATLIAIAESRGFDLTSFMVRLRCGTLAEKFLIPAFVFFFLQLYPPTWISSTRRRTAGAAGGSILIRPEALERAGGIAAIRREIIDDCALARAVKSSGGRVWLGMSPATLSLRGYGTFAEIGRMISRNAFNQLKHSVWMLIAAVAGIVLVYLLPPILLLSHHWVPAALGAAAWLLMASAYLPMVRFYRLSPLWSLSLPLIAIFYIGATVHSAVKFWTGHGGKWKGREQDKTLPELPKSP